MNKKSFYTLSKFNLIIITNAGVVLFSLLFGKESGVPLILFASIILPFIIFEECQQKYRKISCFIPFIAWSFLEQTDYTFLFSFTYATNYNYFFYISMVTFTAYIIYMSIHSFYSSQMISEKKLIEANKQIASQTKLETEYELAKNLQNTMLPNKEAVTVGSYHIDHAYLPSHHLSGDFYTFIHMGKDQLGILVLDIVGKGIQSSFDMVRIKTMLSQMNTSSPKAFFTYLNHEITRGSSLGNKPCAGFYGILNTKENTLIYSDCGIGVAMLYRKQESIPLREYGGMIVGFSESTTFTEGIQTLHKGDRIIIATDGITDIKDKSNKRIGNTLLDTIMESHTVNNTSSLSDTITKKIEAVKGQTDILDDDICMVVLNAQ